MKKILSLMLIAATFIFSTPIHADVGSNTKSTITQTRARGSAASSDSGVSLSMVIWGVVMIAGIVTVCLLVKSSGSHAHN